MSASGLVGFVILVVALIAVSAFGAIKLRASKGPGRATAGLRDQALAMTAEKAGISPASPDAVWGVVVDWALDGGVATIVALVDGTASLYVSTGGGVLGGQKYESVRRAGSRLIDIVSSARSALAPSGPMPLPAPRHVRFYAHTSAGLLASPELPQTDMLQAAHPLATSFAGMQGLIAELRTAVGGRV